MGFLKRHYPLLILLVLALATRFLFLWYPAEVVFDEVHFGKFVEAYSTGKYYFDIHPPLGKLMIAGFAKLAGVTPGASFKEIGEKASQRELLVLRFLPALFGVLFVLVIYQLARTLGLSLKTSFLAGFMVLFENAFLVESKFILVDSFLFFFGFSSLLVFLRSQSQESRFKKHLLYFFSMALAGLAVSIKWTGLSFLGIILVFSFFNFLKNPSLKRFLKFFAEMTVSLGIVTAVYATPFIVHFNLLPLSGPGDAFMSQNFKTLTFEQKFIELNRAMYSYSKNLTATHADGSKWYEWPFDKKSVWYWHKASDGKTADVYLLGNPLIFFLGPLAVFWGIWRWIRERKSPIFLLLLGYFANLIPFVFVTRVAFLYHYLISLGFAVLLFALLMDKILEKRSLRFYFTLLGLIFLTFLAIAPVTYGLVLPPWAGVFYYILPRVFH